MERITRSGNGTDSLHPDVTLLTEELTELLGRVDELLHHRGAVSDVRVAGPSQEAHAELALLLPPEHSLDVHIFVGVDGFEIHVNDTVLRLNRIDFGHESPVWIEACIFTLKALLEHDLVIRLRRTLELRRTGAIWIPDREGGCLEW